MWSSAKNIDSMREMPNHFVTFKLFSAQELYQGLPGGTVVKNPPANAGDTGSSPGPGRSHMPRSN